MKKQLLILMTLIIASIGCAQTFTDNNFDYSIITSTTNVKITNYNSASSTDVVIPATVDYNSITYTVTEIGDNAFLAKGITNLTIPDSITSIGIAAFLGNALNTIVIPDSVITISDAAFASNTSLSNLVIGNSVTNIGGAAFRYSVITNITIPESVTSIGQYAFSDTQLTDFITLATIPPTIITGMTGGLGDTFGDGRSTIDLFIPPGTTSAYVAAQWTGFNSVTETGSAQVGDTFVADFITYEVTSLTPDTVEAIDYDMAGGTVVDIPATVTNIAVTYNVTSIGQTAFEAKGLTSVTIPDGVTNIEFAAFRNNNIVSVIIPNSVVDLANYVFRYNSLTSVTLSENITAINPFTFDNNNLTSISIPDNVTLISGHAFSYNNLTNVIVPNNVTYLGTFAFAYNPITNVVLGSSLSTIDYGAFASSFNASVLTDVVSLSTTPASITTTADGFDSFAVDRSVIHLHIPGGTMGAYVTDPGALWTGFNPVTEDALSVDDFEIADAVKVITTSGEIRIIVSNMMHLQNYSLYTISGSKVAAGTEREIPTSLLARGIYILKLDLDKGTTVKKVIIN